MIPPERPLTQMYRNSYQPDSPYHRARTAFVHKRPARWSPASVRPLLGTAEDAANGSPPPLSGAACRPGFAAS